MSSDETTTDTGTQEVSGKKEIDKLKQSFLTRLSGKISLKAIFATVAGAAAVTAAAIAAPVFLPLTGAFAAAAAITAVGIGVTWAFSQHNDYKKLETDHDNYNQDEMAWHRYYKNGKITKNLGKLSIKGVFATTILGAGAGIAACAALPLLPYIGAAAAASAIVTGGTAAIYGFRRNDRPKNA
jgi:hypothetical protein